MAPRAGRSLGAEEPGALLRGARGGGARARLHCGERGAALVDARRHPLQRRAGLRQGPNLPLLPPCAARSAPARRGGERGGAGRGARRGGLRWKSHRAQMPTHNATRAPCAKHAPAQRPRAPPAHTQTHRHTDTQTHRHRHRHTEEARRRGGAAARRRAWAATSALISALMALASRKARASTASCFRTCPAPPRPAARRRVALAVRGAQGAVWAVEPLRQGAVWAVEPLRHLELRELPLGARLRLARACARLRGRAVSPRGSGGGGSSRSSRLSLRGM